MAKNCTYIIYVLIVLCGCSGRVSQDTISTTVPEVISTHKEDPDPVVVNDHRGDPVVVPPKADPVEPSGYKTLQDIYMSQLYVREATGHNDGLDVEKYLHSTGNSRGDAWCASFVHWCLKEAKIPNKVNAWSPSAENKDNIVFKLREFKEEPKTGDVVTFYYTNLGRIGHTGFYNKKISDVTYESVEGNTSASGGGREQEPGGGIGGVFKKYRSFNSTYSISRWAATQE